MNAAYLILGSNIDPEQNLPAATSMLAEFGTVSDVSQVWESPPVDGSDQPNYLNAAVLLETPLPLNSLRSDVIARIEQSLGRQRDPANRYAARTIDIDVALFNGDVGEFDGRPIPDPDILTRPFVAVPLAEIAPLRVHPVEGRTLAEIAQRLDSSRLRLRDDVVLNPARASE